MLDFSGLAQDFVDATSALVGGRTINIMDENAVIIASTERERIGTFHQGAAEVIATGRTVIIEKDAISHYPGAKEGCNMPIFFKDKLIGVVGIFGCEDEVRNIANILRVYVTQHFSLQLSAQRQTRESEVRSQLLRLLLLGDTEQKEVISQFSDLLELHLTFPVRVLLLRAPEETTPQTHLNRFIPLFQNLLWQGVLDRRQDVFGIQKKDYVIIYSSRPEPDSQPKMLAALTETLRHEKGYRLASGNPCKDLNSIPEGLREASILLNISDKPTALMEETDSQILYLLHKTLKAGGNRNARELYERLKESQDPKQAELLMATARAYYHENGSVQKASELLHIHKNTLLYRMRRLYLLLGLEEETPFVREFLIRLLLLSYPD